ncbi:helix-turn-helix domain-containing protein [Streptomyces sp. NPDC051020]|uniref:helix-turn-helix domain-containing protein n=1 Tax=Streptomyces sp. NPDC051020 TaxID=3155409 RepID=UPI003442BFCD
MHRRFRAQPATAPLAWLTERRITLACRPLERGEERLDVVAGASGLGTATNLRAQLRRRTGLTPHRVPAQVHPEALTRPPQVTMDACPDAAHAPGSATRRAPGAPRWPRSLRLRRARAACPPRTPTAADDCTPGLPPRRPARR